MVRTQTDKEIIGMKNRRLTTILTSAYLSAMLATSVAPIRSDATLAATIDPMAAQKALQNVMSGLDASGWLAASTAGAPPAAQATPTLVPVNNPTPKADPVMTEELMARMLKLAREYPGTSTVSRHICSIFNLCDGTADMTVKLLLGDLTDAKHYLAISAGPNSKDVLIMVKRDTVVDCYLTDKTGTLRAAAILDKEEIHLITNEKAADKFNAELKQYAKEASALPPTGTAVAGNS